MVTWKMPFSVGNSFTRGVLQSILTKTCEPVPLSVQLNCFRRRYRTFDGSCNNLCNITRGSVLRPFARLLPPAYEDGTNVPRTLGSNNQSLPNARNISTIVFVSSTGNDDNTTPNFTHVTMTWGQFLDHDIALTQENNTVDCGNNSLPCWGHEEGCIGIDILQGNELKDNRSSICIPLRRSAIQDGEQVNLVSAFIDGSHIYGANHKEAELLRDRTANLGLLRVASFPLSSAKSPFLPKAEAQTFCRSHNPTTKPCFLAGDHARVNENPALTAMHTIWAREHNRIASYLHVLNPSWQNERLFQEARKIVIAELQHITYNEWLPVFFNEDLRRRENILLEPKDTFFSDYNSRVNPEITNAFATAALRVGHSLIRDSLGQFGRQFRQRGSIPTKTFFDPSPLYSKSGSGMTGILLGLVTQASQKIDRFFTPAVRENLLMKGSTFDGIVGDLAAINIQRGRDHGLPPYNQFRESCGLGRASSIDDLTNIKTTQRERLRIAYNDNVNDIDLYVGGVSETPLPESIVGGTFSCILTRGFKNLRVGDRFWYERNDSYTGFTTGQLNAIRNATLARVLCDNSDGILKITPNVFRVRSGSNNLTYCYDLGVVNLNEWMEEPGQKESCQYDSVAKDVIPPDVKLSEASTSV
ncbi:Peroxidasin [Stylophora pistillata]|uniref:Peroxidasin n=2 Tax=Stylophora pistillata TaxID=50429 RepID=A0A2B4SKD4_STYPI|nr:Peroxidasin [Stylophora pistillata]